MHILVTRTIFLRAVHTRGTGQLVPGTPRTVPYAYCCTCVVRYQRVCQMYRVPWHPRWFGFFAPFFTMFASAPLMNEIRKPSSLDLSTMDIVHADICAVPQHRLTLPLPLPLTLTLPLPLTRLPAVGEGRARRGAR